MFNAALFLWWSIQTCNFYCLERGHALSEAGWVTLAGIIDYTVDLPDRTLRIRYNPNYVSSVCSRCGLEVRQPVQLKPDTTIIWQKKE